MIRANLCKICVISYEKRFWSGVKKPPRTEMLLFCQTMWYNIDYRLRATPNNYCHAILLADFPSPLPQNNMVVIVAIQSDFLTFSSEPATIHV